MRVVVFGAGGFLGQAVVRSLTQGGHPVVGVVRSPAQHDAVLAAGGTPREGDILGASSVLEASTGCDLAIHLAQPSEGDVEAMRRVRVGGCRTLVEALPRAGVRRLVVGSGYWVYADNPEVIREESPLAPMSISQVNYETEEVARATDPAELETVVVRPGMVYGPGSWFAQMAEELRRGTYRYVGDGGGYLSPIHWWDAGEAFRAVCERWTPGRTYLAVDDRPVRTRDFAASVADAIGAPPPRGVPFEEASREWGKELALLNAASRRASNRALKALGWHPRYPTYSEGLPSVLEAMHLGRTGPRR